MASVHKRAAAKRDLVEDYIYLAENSGIEVAERFLAAAEDTFSELARNPGMGAALRLRSPQLGAIRKWRVNGFEKHLIFYLPRPDGVLIVRVLHAAQDWWNVWGMYES